MSSLRIESTAPSGRPDRDLAGPAPAEVRAMRRALRIARRGIGTTHPNPRVGAIVLRGNAPVAAGFHARAGDDHAEVRALNEAGALARDATLVVTLEPCDHVGRTPPCTDAILRSKIRRVVIGMRDPNPLVDGRGIERLRGEGLEVVVGVLEAECRALNPPYLKQLRTGLPWVTLKAMLSLDGRMASDCGESRGLGSAAEQRRVHRLRAENDAVLVGVGTVLADDPLLTVRLVHGRSPWRVVLDSSLRTPRSSRLRATSGESPVVFATVCRDEARIRELEAEGAGVWRFDPDPDGRVPLTPLLRRLADEGRYALLVEGGATVHTSFLREGLADRLALGIAPLILGGSNASSLTGDLGRLRLKDGISVEGLRARRVGPDLWLEASIARNGDAGV